MPIPKSPLQYADYHPKDRVPSTYVCGQPIEYDPPNFHGHESHSAHIKTSIIHQERPPLVIRSDYPEMLANLAELPALGPLAF